MKKIFFKFISILELCLSIFAILISFSVIISPYIYPILGTNFAKHIILPLIYVPVLIFFIY
ncbi:MAG: hypothetical protein ACRC41_15175, partial [Sarcina sp.]